MTRDDAIEILKAIYFLDEKKQKALNMAIEALEQCEMAYEHGWTDAESKYRKILERKQGEWLDYKCSLCGFEPYNPSGLETFNYCSNCGADMRGDTNDEPYTYRQPVKNKWLKRIDNDCQMLECPECESRVLATDYSFAVGNKGYSFCPYCGADLREETDV